MTLGSRSWAIIGVLLILVPAAGSARGGAYVRTAHGDPRTGVQRITTAPRGACAHCHLPHKAESRPTGLLRSGPGLFAANDNALCFACHSDATPAGSFQGKLPYAQSDHARSPSMIWPGPAPRARSGADAGNCVNCHDPHGVQDASGVVPALLVAREDALCLTCHDRSPTVKDVRAQFAKPYKHPIATGNRHRRDEGGNPSRFSASVSDARHVTCSDCHNVHASRPDAVPAQAPDAAGNLVAVGRVRATNGGPGSVPLYTWVPAIDTSFPREYEICFKCHSSWTKQPLGQPDMALLFNPGNASYHPVEAAGRDGRIDPGSFTNGWTAEKTMYCSDCHGSDDPSVRGPHGSMYRHLLRKPYGSTAIPQRMTSSDLCFDCHRYDVYADPSARAVPASRFNPPAAQYGHAYHVGTKGYPCFACHESHGSPLYPSLIVTGRSPGIASFFPRALGGTCTSTCHGSRTYSTNYPR